MSQQMSIAVEAAKQAGMILADYFRSGVRMRSKAPADLVSDADINAERRIVKIIRDAFPNHSILGEEESKADVSAEHLWIIDPLDGTTNFAHQIPHFAVSIAYYQEQKPVCGVVWNPIREDLYQATAGGGASHNGQSISVGRQATMSEALIGLGFYYDRGAMMEATLAAAGDCFRQQIHGIRRFGTASLDLAHVATGCFGAYFEFQLSPWDFAAGRLIVEEAGGQVTNCSGAPLPLTTTSLLASNGLLHDQMLSILGRHC